MVVKDLKSKITKIVMIRNIVLRKEWVVVKVVFKESLKKLKKFSMRESSEIPITIRGKTTKKRTSS